MNREKMRKCGSRTIGLLLSFELLLSGCGVKPAEPTEQTVPPTEYTVPADGNPEDVTCLGSYSRPFAMDVSVARVGDEELTNGELNIFYHLAVNQFDPEAGEAGPDFSLPL